MGLKVQERFVVDLKRLPDWSGLQIDEASEREVFHPRQRSEEVLVSERAASRSLATPGLRSSSSSAEGLV